MKTTAEQFYVNYEFTDEKVNDNGELTEGRIIELLEAYHKAKLKESMKQVFDAYGIGFMGSAKFKHDFDSWFEMEYKNF